MVASPTFSDSNTAWYNFASKSSLSTNAESKDSACFSKIFMITLSFVAMSNAKYSIGYFT